MAVVTTKYLKRKQGLIPDYQVKSNRCEKSGMSKHVLQGSP